MELSNETILKTRQYFITLNKNLIRDVINGDIRVNDPDRFIQWKLDDIEHYKSSPLVMNNFTFLQRAHFIEHGEMLPLLRGNLC